jgi:surface antigen
MKSRSQTAVSSIVVISLFAVLNTGCATQQYTSPQQAASNACSALGPKALSGGLVGGLGGAAAGAGVGAAAGGGRGAAIGAGLGLAAGIIGGLAVGNSLDQNDCAQAQIALAQAAQGAAGQPVAWLSPTGSHGTYTPAAAIYVDASVAGRVCRQFAGTQVIQGHEPVRDSGTICRDGEGDWRRV